MRNVFNEKKLFAKTLKKSLLVESNFFENVILPVLTQEHKQDCNKEIFKNEVIDALEIFSNTKSPGNDDLTKTFYETFWGELKE